MIRNNLILISKISFVCLLLLFSQSCIPDLPKNSDISEKKIKIPESFSANNQLILDDNRSDSPDLITNKEWQVFFEDENLKELIEFALKNNQEFNILNQEIQIANNEFQSKKGEYFPKFSIGAKYEYEKVGELTSQGQNDLNSGVPDKLNNHQIGLSSSWEIDIWKKLRNSAKSSYYQYLASIEGRNFAKTQLVSEVAISYYELLTLDRKIDIVEEYIEILRDVKEILKIQQIAAKTNYLAIKRFDAELKKNESLKFEILREIKLAENRINKLIGRLPQKIERSSLDYSLSKVKKFDIGIPADLLNNRPDIKKVSLELEAAKLNIKSIKANFYPSLSIDGNVGYQAFNSAHLIKSPTSVFYNIAGGISAPILNRKAIKAQYFSANNKQIQAIYEYEKTFIKAYSEVSSQLASIENFTKINELKLKQVESLKEAVELANLLFNAARIDYLESLLTKREYLIAQIELSEAKQNRINSLIMLYKSLGGGWYQSAS